MKNVHNSAITGCGVLSGGGFSFETTRHSFLQKTSCVRDLGLERKGSVAEEPELPFLYQRKALKMMDRRGRLAMAAAMEAMRSSGLDYASSSLRRGVSMAVGISSPGENLLEEVFVSGQDDDLTGHLNRNLNPLWLLGRLPNMPASHLSIQFGAQGPVLTSLDGKQALQDAMDAIGNDEADVFLAGASEAWFSPAGLAALGQKRGVQGEASVFFVVESMEHAQARQARILGEWSFRDLESDPVFSGKVEEHFGHCGCAAALLPLALSLAPSSLGA